MPALTLRGLFVAAALLLMGARATHAQTPRVGPARASVAIDVVDGAFGVGGISRPGGWIGVRLRVTDSSTTARELLLRVEGFDPDGDQPLFEQVVPGTAAPGFETWAYVRLPTHFDSTSSLRVTATEAIATDDAIRPYRSGNDLLGSALLPPTIVVTPEVGLIGVVHSTGSFDLASYSTKYSGSDFSPLAHERTEVISQLTPEQLPDRWIGLSQLSVLVWGDADPSRLGTERPRAIREWVQRGGHLVIVLPAATQTWTDARSNPLYSMLPVVSIAPAAGGTYDLNALLPILAGGGKASVVLPTVDTSVIVRELSPAARASQHEAMSVLTDAQGRVLVARRLVGLGMVTIVGIDLGARVLRDRGLPRADMFWNRVLGRRGEFLPISEVLERERSQGLSLSQRQSYWFDDDIRSQIAKSGRSATALLLAFVVFSAYWVIAGPAGFGVLKRLGLSRLSWPAYLGAAVVFTTIAWTGAFVLRPKRLDARHVTFLDGVYEQPVQRSRTWMSLLVPSYGETTVHVGDDESGPGREQFHNLVSPWQPRQGSSSASGFPDVRPYGIDSRSPDEMTFPTRATVKQLAVDWAGVLPDDWRMPRPVLGPGGTGEPRITVDPRGIPAGFVRHDLPAPLTDVRIIVVSQQATTSSTPSARLLANARVFRAADAWNPGEAWDFSKFEADRWEIVEPFLRGLVPAANNSVLRNPDADGSAPGDTSDHFTALSLFEVLAPPDFPRGSANSQPLVRRSQTHGLGLSAWFTQPCVIVIGHIRSGPCPTPFSTGAGESRRPVRSEGWTVVRWVYPLPPNPPEWPAPEPDSVPGSSPPAG